MTTVVDVTDVWFSYPNHLAVKDVSFTIQSGEFVGLIGPNGSGKTTLLRLILGLAAPDEGHVTLFGEDATDFDDGERISHVAQRAADRGGSMPVTVEEVVSMGRFVHRGRSRLHDRDWEVVRTALERVGLADLTDRRLDRLSGGQRQRTYIARALASEAEFLALDEPTAGVDAGSRDDFYGLLDRLNDEGLTVLLIEHDIDVLTKYVDTVACINQELYYHGDSVDFLESEALAAAYGDTHGILHHDHP